jgi:hypothetical protein
MRRPNNVTRKTPKLLLFRPAKGVIAMPKSKTYFEQIPVAAVKKIAELFYDDVAATGSAVPTTSASKLRPHGWASPGKNGKRSNVQPLRPEINCAICNKSVALDASKTDEFGRAIHEECYLLKVGSGTLPNLRP